MSTEQELPDAEPDRAAKEVESELKDSELDGVAGGFFGVNALSLSAEDLKQVTGGSQQKRHVSFIKHTAGKNNS